MTNVWVDTNILLRFLTRDVADQGRRVRTVMERAARGELSLRVPSVVIAEVVWVLGSVYKFDRHAITDSLRDLALADGIVLDEPDVVLDALRLMSVTNVAYVDAYLAAKARHHAEPVLTFDADFRRFGVELVS